MAESTLHNHGVIYRGFPSRSYHEVPSCVEPDALFHIRIAVDREKQGTPLTFAPSAKALLDSAKFYQTRQRWHIALFLLMPDHLHALLSFARDRTIVGQNALHSAESRN